MSEKIFKNLFTVFSVMLIFNYPILPLLQTVKNNGTFCVEGSYLICAFTAIAFILLIWFFWCAIWLINYVTFYTKVSKNSKNKITKFLYHHVFYKQFFFKNNSIEPTIITTILILLCFAVLYLFLSQITIIIST